MVIRPNLSTFQLARGREDGTLSVSRIVDSVVLWCGEDAHRGAITALEWSPDCQFLASGGQDGLVRVWEANTGDLVHSFRHREEVRRLRWLRLEILASISHGYIHLWPLPPAVAAAAA